MSKIKTYEKLEAQFEELFKQSLPKIETTLPTFQNIAGYPNYENVFSNIYQFCLTIEEPHGWEDLFLLALDDCLDEVDILMDDYYIQREYPTNKGGRIDLIILENTETPNKVVIIENKINHTLSNDFEDYWNTFHEYTERIGIILTLHKINTPPNFINVTHQEWMQKVKSRLGNMITKIHVKYLVMLQDFIEHFNTFYQNKQEVDALKFLYERGELISELKQIEENGRKALNDDLKRNISESDWRWLRVIASGASMTDDEGLYLYVHYDSIFANKTFSITLWIRNAKNVNRWVKRGNTPKMKKLAKKANIELFEAKANSKEWGHIAEAVYTIDRMEDLTQFGQLVSKVVQKDWDSFSYAIYEDIIQS